MHWKKLTRLTCVVVLAGCVVGVSAAAASAATLTGAGSTLAAPIIEEWAAAWGNSTGNTVSYGSVGSGAGYKDIAGGLVDFGASDAPLATYSSPPCNNCVQMPWGLSGVGISYHVNGMRLPRGKALHLTGSLISQIYLGQIKNWDDPRIRSLNPGAHIPSTPIQVFWRSDGSGTTYTFSRYESDVSSAFAHQVGASTTVSFPVGAGAKGNSGMAAATTQTNGAIAYIEIAYLIGSGLPAAAVKNSDGRYISPNLTAIEAAASIVHSVPSNNQITIVDPPKRAKSAYPISTFTYVIVPTTAPQGGLLRQFINYAITTGQRFGPAIGFAPLAPFIVRADQATLNRIN